MADRNLTEMRFPVQYVIRPDLDFRGFAGQVIERRDPERRRGNGAAFGADQPRESRS